LFGVRFGKQTCYCLLDIDITSAYHPDRDPFAIANLVAALEPLGLVSSVVCTSSHSNGIHLYFPFQQPQSSWEVAMAVSTLLEQSGFKLAPGQLELFPNPRPYVSGGPPSLFHAHRLPLQVGSYLLDADFQPIWSDRAAFVRQWQFAQGRNSLIPRQLKRLVRSRARGRQVSGKAEQFLADLNAEIELGWTGAGQTNRLLGRIALRTYIFHHLQFGGEPLNGQALIGQIVSTARSLPGYREWCRHQHEIEERAAEWGRCVEASRYFPYGSRRSPAEVEKEVMKPVCSDGSALSLTWNQQQSQATRERIKQAIADLLEAGALPTATTARFRALTQFGIGGSSLYRHRDLWHPESLVAHLEKTPVRSGCVDAECAAAHSVENPPDPLATNLIEASDRAGGASDDLNSTSLFPLIGGNVPQGQVSGRSIDLILEPGCNTSHLASLPWKPVQQHLCPLRLTEQRMQQFLDSGDPILVAEARSYFQAQRVNGRRMGQAGLKAEVSQNAVGQEQGNWCNRGLDQVPVQELDHGSSQFFTENCPDGGERWTETSFSNLSSEDFSDLLATIAIQIRRLGWTKKQAIRHLWQQFGKSHQSRLSHEELVKWLEWLKAYGFPADTG
jgi:hypothetical protein